MPQSLTIRNKKNGRMAKVNWNSDSPPSKEDIDQIFEEQGQRSRDAVDKVANQPLNLSPTEQFMQDNPTFSKGVSAVNDFLPKLESINPVAIVGSAIEGGSRLLRGHGFSKPLVDPQVAPDLEAKRQEKTDHPRLSGLNMLGDAAMRAGSYALPGAALAAPYGTALGLGGGIAGSYGARALVPGSAPAEYKDAAALAGGIIGGTAGAVGGNKMQNLLRPKTNLTPAVIQQGPRPYAPPPSVKPPTTNWTSGKPTATETNTMPRLMRPDSDFTIQRPGQIQPRIESESPFVIKAPGRVGPEPVEPQKLLGSGSQAQDQVQIKTEITKPAQIKTEITKPALKSPNEISGFQGEPINKVSNFATKNLPLEDMKTSLEPDPLPEPEPLKSAKQVREKQYNDYFSSMSALDDPKSHDVSVPWVVGKAKEVGRSPSEAAEDLRISDVPQEKIDAAIRQHYPDPIDDEVDSYEDTTDC